MHNCIAPEGHNHCLYAAYLGTQHTPNGQGTKRELWCTYTDPARLVIKKCLSYTGSPDWCPLKHGTDSRPIADNQLHCRINSCKSSNGDRLCCWVCKDREACDDKCGNRPSACGQTYMMGGSDG